MHMYYFNTIQKKCTDLTVGLLKGLVVFRAFFSIFSPNICTVGRFFGFVLLVASWLAMTHRPEALTSRSELSGKCGEMRAVP